jgi:hypothetical protein
VIAERWQRKLGTVLGDQRRDAEPSAPIAPAARDATADMTR